MLQTDSMIPVVYRPIGRHEAYYKSKTQQTLTEPSGAKFEFLRDEMIRIEVSHKVRLTRSISKV